MTVIVLPLSAVRLTVNFRSSPSSPSASAIKSVGGSSSSRMVPVAVGAESSRVAPVGSERATVKVWSSSSVVSFSTGTVKVAVVWPAGMVSVPVAVSPVSMLAVQVAVTSLGLVSDRVAVNSTPASSAPLASAMLSVGRGVAVVVSARPSPTALTARTSKV